MFRIVNVDLTRQWHTIGYDATQRIMCTVHTTYHSLIRQIRLCSQRIRRTFSPQLYTFRRKRINESFRCNLQQTYTYPG